MKNAILFFGQPRYVKNQQVQKCYLDLIKKYDCDVFCHTWFSEKEQEYSCSTWSNIIDCKVEKDSVEVIKNVYKPKILLEEASRSFSFCGDLEKFINNKFTNKSSHFNEKNYNNIISQLYSIEQVSKIFCSSDIEKYKFIILTRFDTILTDIPDLYISDENKFYIQNNHTRFPDMSTIYGKKFLEWSKNLYTDLSNEIEIYKNIWEPSPEAFKYASFIKRFQSEDIVPCIMRGHAMRSL